MNKGASKDGVRGDDARPAGSGEIAVIGMACRFPGAKDCDEFWRNLRNGIDSVREIPADRWSVEDFYAPDPEGSNKSNSKWCGVLDDIDKFDNGFFNISPREARSMDPQQRLLLEETWHCIEDSGVPLSALQGSITSVFSGVMINEYCHQALLGSKDIDCYLALGTYESILANRISYLFGLRGVSKPVNAACASSLLALHEARNSLLQAESDYALVSGVNLNLHPWKYICFSKSGMLSPKGACKAFDKDADGYVPGDGVGVLLLQRLDDAVKSGCHIYGIVKGSAANHGGKSPSITAPRLEAQREVILAAYRQAGFSPETVTYMEAHGTGTPLGDPIEIEALTQAFREHTPENRFCAIGSVKSNIGHLEAASGIAGVFKVLLMMRHREIPRTLHVRTLNPLIDFDSTPFMVATRSSGWSSRDKECPLRAGVSSFGFGGVNCHLLLEEFRGGEPARAGAQESRDLFVLSAKTPESLKGMIEKWGRFVENDSYEGLDLKDICGTLLTGRGDFPHRYASMVGDKQALRDFLRKEPVCLTKPSKGPWHLHIGKLSWGGFADIRPLVEKEELFRENLSRALAALSVRESAPGLEEAFRKERWDAHERPLHSCIVGYSYANTLVELGFSPQLVTGEDDGILVALALSAMVSLEDVPALLLGKRAPDQIQARRPSIPFQDPLSRQTLMPYLFDAGYLASLLETRDLPAQLFSRYLRKAKLLYESRITFRTQMDEWEEVAQPRLSILGMLDDPELETAPGDQARDRRFLLLLAIVCSMSQLNPNKKVSDQGLTDQEGLCELLDLLVDGVMTKELLCELLTGSDPDLAGSAATLNARQGKMNPRSRYRRLKERNRELPVLEDLATWIVKARSARPHEHAGKGRLVVIGSLGDGTSPGGSIAIGATRKPAPAFRQSLLQLWMQGVNFSWEKLYLAGSFNRLSLPGYVFQRESFRLPRPADPEKEAGRQPLLRDCSAGKGRSFTARLTGTEFFLADHVVAGRKTLPAVVFLEMARAAGEMSAKRTVRSLQGNVWLRPVSVGDASLDVQVTLDADGDRVEYQVSSLGEESGKTIYAQGRIFYDAAPGDGNGAAAHQVDLDLVRGRCPAPREGSACYHDFQKIGLEYGPSFRPMRDFSCNDQEALSRLELPETLRDRFDDFLLHPSLLDGALQTVVGLAISRGAGEAPLLPFAVGAAELCHPLQHDCYAYVEWAGAERFQVALLDNSGLVCVRLRDVSIRPLRDPLRELFYLPRWRELSLPVQVSGSCRRPEGEAGIPRRILLLCPLNSMGLEEALAGMHGEEEVIRVRMGNQTRRHADDSWEIDGGDLSALAGSLPHLESVDTVYHLGGLWTEEVDPDDLEALERSQELGVFSLFRLVKLLWGDRSAEHPLRLKVVANNLYPVTQEDPVIPYSGSLVGMAGSIARECPHWEVTCVDICFQPGQIPSGEETAATAQAIVREGGHACGEAVAIRHGKRYLRVFEPSSLPQVGQAPFRQGGVYLIVGGGGGIGLELALNLAKTVGAKVALLGRSGMTAGLADRIAQIESSGGEVLYLRADVTDPESMKLAVAQVRERFGPITGAIHSAIVLKDRALRNMDEESLRLVLAPKVRGSVVLHGALKGETLDFMLFFSSVLAITGNPGQSNYVSGCSFKDAYAQALDRIEPYRVQGINWGYWGSVGIVASEAYSRLLAAQGLLSIKVEEGMEAVRRVLACTAGQIVCVRADHRLLEKMGVDPRQRSGQTPPTFEEVTGGVRLPPVHAGDLLRLQQGFEELEIFAADLLLHVLQGMGAFRNREGFTKRELRKQLEIIPGYHRLFDVLLEILARAGLIRISGDQIERAECGDGHREFAALQRKQELIRSRPEIQAHVEFLRICLNAYPEVLRGRKGHMEVLFPDGSKTLVESIYRGNERVDYHNRIVAEVVKSYVRERIRNNPSERIAILEVGAGTGGTSSFVLEALADLAPHLRYLYTDISLGFTHYGNERFGADYPFVEFKLLNVEQDPQGQGFEPHAIDLVFATNVVHATRRIGNTLTQIKRLLKTGGLLVLNEITQAENFLTLTFGLTDGWWLFEDGENRLKGAPLIGADTWNRILEGSGFGKVESFGLPGLPQERRPQSVLVAESDGGVESEEEPEMERIASEAAAAAVGDDREHRGAASGEGTCSEDDLRERATDYLKGIFAEVLRIGKNGIDSHSNFERYGVDSLMTMDLTKRLAQDLGRLSATLLFENSSVAALAEYFLANRRASLEKALGWQAPAPRRHAPVTAAAAVQNEGEEPAAPLAVAAPEAVGAQARRKSSGAIAIVGMSGRYPAAESLDEFWENLKAGRNCTGEIPAERWDWRKYHSERPEPGKSYSRWGGFLAEVDCFDPLFFNISPKEAELTDPQERLFLETAWKLFEDAGITRSRLAHLEHKVGVFVGVMNNYYVRHGGNSSHGSIANRVSYFFDLRGPSFAVDTACSSSLTAIHMACESIGRGECRAAIAGGVNLILHPDHFSQLSALNMLSRGDACKAFGAGADGFVDGEGVGALLLRPLESALADGDRIYAVVRGSSINAGGKTSGYTVPNPNAQADLVREALANAGVDPRTVSYVEAHGTGTSLGDPIEVAGLTKAYREYTQDRQYCAIGSVKSNIGHLESAAGIAGITKVILQMRHRQLVPSLHSETLNPNIEFEETPFYVQQKLSAWTTPSIHQDGTEKRYPRRAGVSSFGAGGANAHIVLEEYEKVGTQTDGRDRQPQIVILSAKNGAKLKAHAGEIAAFLDSKGDAVHLAEVAYTLQTGREAMDERLALMVSSTEELREKLRKFQAAMPDIDGLFEGNAKAGRAKAALVIKGRSGQQYLRSLLQEGELQQLGLLWASGVEIEWELLWGQKPDRISLPCYPFERKRCWIESKATSPAPDTAKRKLHPLLEENTSNLREQSFTTRFSGHEFCLSDHVVGGEKVLPGVAYLEMARAAGKLAGEKPVKAIKNTVWAKPITVGDEVREIRIVLYPQGEIVEYEVTSDGDNGDSVVHAQGKLLLGEEHAGEAETIDIEAVKRRCTETKTGNECYQFFGRTGLQYGPSFRSINELYAGSGECLALLELPGAAKGSFSQFGLHPSLTDAALQSVMGLLREETEGTGAVLLPFALGELQIFSPLSERCYAYATAVADRAGSAVKRFDICLVDAAGRVQVKMKDFSLRALPGLDARQQSVTAHRAGSKNIYYQTAWERSEREPQPAKEPLGQVLVFDMDGDLRGALEKCLAADGESGPGVTLVQPGAGFHDFGDGTYEIRPGEREDYRRLLAELESEGMLPRAIVHAWSGEPSIDGKGTLDRELEKGIYSLLHFSQALMEQKPKGKVRLLHTFTCRLDQPQPHHCGIGGFARTIRLENPNFAYQTVETDPSLTLQQKAALLLGELLQEADRDTDIRLDGESRFVRRHRQEPATPKGEKGMPLRAGGVYLITGGAGGLGLIFAEYLAKRVKARLVLTGRSQLTEEKDTKLRELEAQGCEVVYIEADVSKSEEAERVVSEAKARFGAINGVIHSAGVIRDGLILKKTKEDMAYVLAPKVHGTVYLDEATKGEPLDFFVLFSSVAAVLGNAGQSDYAYGNSFMDSFAGLREMKKRPGKSLSINWPLWKDGGMRVDEQTEIWLEKRFGLLALSTEDGLGAFEQGLRGETTQLIVMSGNKDKLNEQLGVRCPPQTVASAGLPLSDVSRDAFQDKVEKELTGLLVELLKATESDIDTDEELGNYGVDSIMMMTIMNRIEEMYGGTVEPNAIAEHNTVKRLAAHLIDEGVAGPASITQQPAASEEEGLPSQRHAAETSERVPCIRERRARFSHMPVPSGKEGEKIAVIGSACRFPQSPSMEAFWENLRNGKNMVTEVPQERWAIADYFSSDRNARNKSYSKWGGYIEGAYFFDADYFGIADSDALVMDPQHRILLELTEELFCRAGYSREEMNNSRTGVFIGGGESGYAKNNEDKISEVGMKHIIVNSIPNMMAARISDFYNLRSSSQTIDTACSSSLVAIHVACRSIRNGESDMAIAGGIKLLLDQSLHVGFSKAEVLSDDGVSYVFDEKAKGFVLGEGAGIVLLKGYDAAVRDGDHILGVIRGSAVNNDGRTMGLTVPNMEAQKEVIVQALTSSGVTADTISYLEAHGTGTLLGDPIEIKAATMAFREDTTERQYCAVGSVKSNMGHLTIGAGVASFIKVLLALQEKQIPPTLHCAKPHPRFKFENSPFYPVTQTEKWMPRSGVRRAGISSFGFGGTNCHMILEEFIGDDNYTRTRSALPVTRFKRKRYLLGAEIVDELPGDQAEDAFLLKLLEDVERGLISSEQALQVVETGL